MLDALRILKDNPSAELIWASPRELLNIFQANEIGCHIITVTNDILNKLSLVGYNLDEYSLDTVKCFTKTLFQQGSNYNNYILTTELLSTSIAESLRLEYGYNSRFD